MTPEQIGKSRYQTGIREALTTVFRCKKLIITVFILVTAAMTVFTFALPEIYESGAKLLVKPGRESTALDPSVVGPKIALVGQSFNNQVESQLQVLTSHHVASQVVDEIGVERILLGAKGKSVPKGKLQPVRDMLSAIKGAKNGLMQGLNLSHATNERDNAIDALFTALRAKRGKDSNVINVTLESPDPQLAQDALHAWVQRYLEHSIECFASEADPDFFQLRIDESQEIIVAKTAELRELRGEHRIADSPELQQAEITQSINNLEAELTTTMSEAEAARKRVEVLGKVIENRERITKLEWTDEMPNFLAHSMKELEVATQNELIKLQALYPDDHRLVVEVRERLRVAEKALDDEPRTYTQTKTGIDREYDEVNHQYTMDEAKAESLEARGRMLNENLERRRMEFSDLIQATVSMRRIEHELGLAEKEYSDYRDNLLRANVFAALDKDMVSNVSIVQDATLPDTPVRPNRPLNILLGMLLGIMAGVAVAFGWDFLDESLKTNEDVERRLGLPVLATFSGEEFKQCT